MALILARPCEDAPPIDKIVRSGKSRATKLKSKATLVVCPVSLVMQWANEVYTKTRPHLKVFVHHGPNRADDPLDLLDYDVIVTAYTTVAGECTDQTHRVGPLSKIKFHRVILDEAHSIKNKRTNAAMACFRLEADYRIAMTATPIQNKIDEL